MKRRSAGPYLIVGSLVAVGTFLIASRFANTDSPINLSKSSSDTIKKIVAAVPAPTCASTLGTTKKVGIQAGHWNIDQLPDELSNLQWDLGASADGVNEVDINKDIAQKAATILEAQNISVDVLPATVPEDYCASAFVAIHVDGNDDTSTYGYKVAPSALDTTGKAQSLSDNLNYDYGQVTSMYQNPTITDDMRDYYAFNYEKFTHSIDSETPGAIIELGFVTNATDRAVLVNDDQTVAQGVAQGIIDYLNGKQAPVQSTKGE